MRWLGGIALTRDTMVNSVKAMPNFEIHVNFAAPGESEAKQFAFELEQRAIDAGAQDTSHVLRDITWTTETPKDTIPVSNKAVTDGPS